MAYSYLKTDRGLKPGQRHEGQFKKGYDPRRYVPGSHEDRRKRNFQELVKEQTEKAVNILVACIEDENAPWKERREAAALLLAHGHGLPVNRHLLAQAGDNSAPDTLTTAQLIAMLEDTPPMLSETGGDDSDKPPPQICDDSPVDVSDPSHIEDGEYVEVGPGDPPVPFGDPPVPVEG